jgi:hypothetical protein
MKGAKMAKEEKPNGKPDPPEKAKAPEPVIPSRLKKMRLAELRAEAAQRGLDIKYTPKTYRRDYIAAILSPPTQGAAMAKKKESAPKYRVARAFAHEGVYYTNDNIHKLDPKVAAARASRGYLVGGNAPAAETTETRD